VIKFCVYGIAQTAGSKQSFVPLKEEGEGARAPGQNFF